MRLTWLLALSVLTAACDHKETEAERRAAVAEVEANQVAPPEGFGAQVIDQAESDRRGLIGAGCSFVPEGGDQPVAILLADEGYMKRKDKLVRFAADKGSAKLPYLAWSKYDARDYAVKITLDRADDAVVGDEATNYPAAIDVSDAKGRPVYQARGTATCGA